MSEFLYVNGRLKRSQEQQDKYIAYSDDIDYENSNYNVHNVREAIDKLFEEIELLKNNNPNPPVEGQYTVSFNLNGGSGTTPSPITANIGESILLPTSTGFYRTGHDFYKWSTSTTSTGTIYNPSTSYTFNENTTLYAKWQIKTYTVTFNSNGGTGTISSKTANYGGSISLPGSSGLTREGYTFNSWNENSEGTGRNFGEGDSYEVTKNTTLYAIWDKDTTFYYYVGTTKPTSLSQATIVDSYPAEQTFTNTGTSKCYVYVLTNADKMVNIYDAAMPSIPLTTMEDTTSIPGYKITTPSSDGINPSKLGINGQDIIKIV